jgi:hypothetical protein
MGGKKLALLAVFLALPVLADVVVVGPQGPGVSTSVAYKTKALTAGAATGIFEVPIAAGQGTGGRIFYTVFATDGTDHQVRSGVVSFAVVNKGATETCVVNGSNDAATVNPAQTQDNSAVGAISSGTLTYTWGVSTTPANACDLQLNAASSLTETVLEIRWTVQLYGPSTIVVL